MYAFFYPVDNNMGYDRHEFDSYTDSKTIAEMLSKVDGLKVYNLECDLYDLMEDYNDEELDGGYWMIVLDL